MNNAYKLVYSAVLKTWVAVAEHVKGRGKQGGARKLTTATLLGAWGLLGGLALAAPPSINQLPTGAQVASGAVIINQTQTAKAATMAIRQASQQAIVNWQNFNLGANAQVQITQPDSKSILLNRVMDSNPSQIFGRIKANGQVFLTNPSGVYFAPGSSVDVGSFTASTHSISDSDFLQGNYNFKRNDATGSILNQGSITAGLGGFIALLAPEVRNQGVVVAQVGGTIVMAAGESMQLTFNANKKLTSVLVSPATIQTLVDNGNAVQAPGGLIILSAQSASSLLGGVVKNSSAISATGLVSDGGAIRLSASHKIELGQSSSIVADAAKNSTGNGGRIEVIADLGNSNSITQVDGALSAKGGVQGGDGGFVETSAANLNIAETARVSTLAPKGKAGTWFLDPEDFKVAEVGGNITPTNLVAALNSSGVTITTTATTASCVQLPNVACGSGGAGNGDISIDSPISGWTANPLTLTAYRNVNFNAAITGSGSSTLNAQGGAGGVISLNANIATGGAQTYTGIVTNGYDSTGAVVLGANAALSNTNSNIIFNSTLDSAAGNNFALSVNNGTGETKLLGGVGRNSALSSLSLGGTGPITFAGDIYTTGAQSYSGPVSLFAITSRDFLLKTTNSKVEFLSRVDAADQNFSGETLTITNGSGNVSFGGPVGSVMPLGTITITGGSTATAQTTTFSADVKTNGFQTYGGNLKLNSNLSLSTLQNGNVTIAGNVDTTVQSSLLFQFLGGGNYSYSNNSGTSWVTYTDVGNSSYAASVIAGFGSVSYDSTGRGAYSWTPSSTTQAKYLAIGGGGSGGDRTGAGGGAGGVLTGNANFSNASPYSIVVGAGGVITNDIGFSSGVAGYGSTVSGSGISIVAYGGGGGGVNINAGGITRIRSGTVGASGGGGSDASAGSGTGIPNSGSAESPNPILPLLNQGNSGGNSDFWGNYYSTGGGGGAGGAGQNGNSLVGGGAGGIGIANPIAGSNVGQNSAGTFYIAGGGGGGSFGANAAGGLGGGGSSTGNAATAGALTNAGGGGGGSKFNGTSSGAGGSGAVVINGSVNNQFALSVSSGSGKTTIGGSVSNVTALSIASTNADSQVTGAISGSTAVNKSGSSGVLSLSGNNTYTGGTIISAGTLKAGSATAFGTSAVSVANGAALDLNGQAITSTGTLTLNGNGVSNDGALTNSSATGGSYAGAIELATDAYIGSVTGGITLINVLSGSASLTKPGAGTLTLSGTNTYTGGTTVSAGTLRAGINSTGNVTNGPFGRNNVTVNGGTVDLYGFNVANAFSLGASATAGALINNSGNAATASGAVSLTVNSSLGGTGALTVSGAISSGPYGLVLLGGGAKTLSSTSNALTTLASGTGVGVVTVVNNAALTIGQVATGGSTYSGIDSTGTVSIITLTGDLSISQNIATTSTSTSTSTPALKLSAADGTAAGTLAGGNVVLTGSPSLSVGTGGIAVIYSGDPAASTGVSTAIGSQVSNFSLFNKSTANANLLTAAGHYALYRALGLPIYLLADAGQSSIYGTSPVLSYWYSSSASSVVPVAYAGIPATAQTYSLLSGSVSNSINVSSGVTGNLLLTGSPTIANGGLVATTNAGTYALTLTPTLSLPGYIFNAGNVVNYIIRPAPLSITASNATKPYDKTAYSGGNGVTYSGFVNSETQSVLGGTLSYTGSSQGAINAGNYVLTPVGLVSSNYSLSFVDGSLSITKAPLIATGNSASVRYNGSNQIVSGLTVSGLQGNDTLASLSNLTASGATAKNAGNYVNTVTAGVENNYTVSTVNGALEITKADAVVRARSDLGLTYNGVNQTVSGFTATGLVGGETAPVLTGVTASRTEKNAGTYVTSASGTDGNYNLSFVDGSMVIAKAPLSITAVNGNKQYDGTAHSGGFGISTSGFVNNETQTVLGGTLSYAGTSQGAINAGNYVVTPTGLISGNYDLNYTSGSLTVNPAVIVVVPPPPPPPAPAPDPEPEPSYTFINGALVGSVSKVYDGTNKATFLPSNFSLFGFASGEGATVTKTQGTYDTPLAGTAKMVSVSLTEADYRPVGYTNFSNYILPSSLSGRVGVISKAPLVVNAVNAAKIYDGQSYTGGNGVNISGFVNGEAVASLVGSIVYTGSSQGARDAGTYAITPTGLSGSNYEIKFNSASLEIAKLSLVAKADQLSKPFMSADPALTYTVTGLPTSATASAVLSGNLVRVPGESLGTYVVKQGSLAANLNYDLKFESGNLQITPGVLSSASSVFPFQAKAHVEEVRILERVPPMDVSCANLADSRWPCHTPNTDKGVK